MATHPLEGVVRYLRRISGASDGSPTDEQLLTQFASDRSPQAFEVLVRRHCGLVLGVCRRALGNSPEVEDAFQATFLVLARKAGSIRKKDAVGSWLHGVAHKIAVKLRAKLAAQRRRETNLGTAEECLPMSADPFHLASLRELAAILDEELQRLPAGCRAALVACHLEGQNTVEAAHQLGLPVTTLKSRLQRGRELLRRRLERRGVGLSVTALTILFAEQSKVRAAAGLVRATVDAALSFAASGTATVSSQAAALAVRALKTTLLGKVKVMAFAILTFGVLGLGATVRTAPAPAPTVPDPAKPNVIVAQKAIVKDQLDQHGDKIPAGALARLGTVRWRHGATPNFAAFTPDGKMVVSADDDGIIHVWEFPSGREIRQFGQSNGRSGRMLQEPVALSEDGDTVAATLDDIAIRCYDVATGKELSVMKIEGKYGPTALKFAPDGKTLAGIDSDSTIRIWDWANAKELRKFSGPTEFEKRVYESRSALAFSRDGKSLLATFAERLGKGNNSNVYTIRVFDPSTGFVNRAIPREGSPFAEAPAFSLDGTFVAIKNRDLTTVVDVATGKELCKFPLHEGAMVFSPDGKKIYARSLSTVRYPVAELDATTGAELRTLSQASTYGAATYESSIPPPRLAISPDAKFLIGYGTDHALQFFDLKTGKEFADVEGHARPALTVRFLPDGKELATLSYDLFPLKWDAATGRATGNIGTDDARRRYSTTIISPDCKVFAGQSLHYVRGTVGFVDVDTGKILGKFPMPDSHQRLYGNMVFGPDSKILAVRWDVEQRIEIYESPTAKLLHKFPIITSGKMSKGSHRYPPETMFFSPNGKLFAAYFDERELGLWEVATGRRIGTLSLPDGIPSRHGAFSPDSRAIALDMSNGTVDVYELKTGKLRQTFGNKAPPVAKGQKADYWAIELFTPGGHQLGCRVAFSPDGKLLAHAGLDRKVHVWDVLTGRELAAFAGHTGPLSVVAFSPDGTKLASGSADTTALIWDLKGIIPK